MVLCVRAIYMQIHAERLVMKSMRIHVSRIGAGQPEVVRAGLSTNEAYRHRYVANSPMKAIMTFMQSPW